MTLHPDDLPRLLGIPLSDEQLAAATADLAPGLIVAGAGTGKTTVMAARVVWLIASAQVRPSEVLGLTFTNKAAAELRHRIRVAIHDLPHRDDDDGSPMVSTYHAFAGSLLTEFGALLGLEDDARVLTDGQRARLAFATACRPAVADQVVAQLAGDPVAVARRIRDLDDTLADLDVDVAELRAADTDWLRRIAAVEGPAGTRADMAAAAQQRLAALHLVDQFRNAKLAGEYLDFADQVRHSARLAAGHPDVGHRLRQRHRIVLLDEYQDTSRAQRRMLQALFAGGHPVTAVGDPCQAIYGWRGASVTNIDQFPRQFRRADGAAAQTFSLSINRRSKPAILAAANDVAADLRRFHDGVMALRAPNGVAGGRVAVALLHNEADELTWLADRISQARARHGWSDMAVLCRSNDQVINVVDTLRSVGVPAAVASRRDLLALPEVRQIIDILQILVEPDTNPAVLRVLTGPRWRIGPRDLAVLARRARDLVADESGVVPRGTTPRLLDALHNPGMAAEYSYSSEARTRFTEFIAEIDHLSDRGERLPVDVVSAVIDRVGPGLLPIDAAAAPDSWSGLVSLAAQFRALDGTRSLAEFVAYLADCERFDTSPDEPVSARGDAVVVMTMHAAKGLEFPFVALPFWSDRVFPSSRGSARWVTSAAAVPPVAPDEPDPALALGFPGDTFTGADTKEYVAACAADDRRDEDRLAYVALTRAKDELVVSGHWWGPTQKRPRGPSPYLTALRHRCESGLGAVDVWVPEPGDLAPPQPPGPVDPHEAQAAQAGEAGEAAQAGQVLRPWPGEVQREPAQRLADLVTASGVDSPERLAAPWRDTVAALLDRHAPVGDATVPQVVAASTVLQWVRDPVGYAAEVRRPMPRRPSPAAQEGVAFHDWMAARPGQQTLFDLPTGADPMAGEQATRFEAMLATTRFADRVPVATEHPFVMAVEGLVVTGRIDAVFAEVHDPRFDWEVVDWKTGSADRADPAQLSWYREAWARVTGADPTRIRATFVFVADGTEQSYVDLRSPAEVVRELTRHPH